MSFDGFPENVRATPVPDPFFNSLLAEIEDGAELKVTLRAFWLLAQKRGGFRVLAEEELVNDPTLLRGMKGLGGLPGDLIRRGLKQAVARGTLLAGAANPAGPLNRQRRLYLLNTPANRRELARRRAAGDGELGPGRFQYDGAAEPPAEERPNIYALYEDNIGTIGVAMAEQLREAEERYPERWIAEAFHIAVGENKRSWSYISAILRRWAAEGRGGFREAREEGEASPGEPGIGVKAGATLWEREGRQHGEPGRHTEADNRQGHREDYQRRWGRTPGQ